MDLEGKANFWTLFAFGRLQVELVLAPLLVDESMSDNERLILFI